MVQGNIEKFVAIGKDVIVCSKHSLNQEENLKIRYRVDKEEKVIRLYDVPRILNFQEKSLIYYAILDSFYFYPLKMISGDLKDENIEDYVVKENGYSYHEFNGIEEKDYGILGELLFEVPRQNIEMEKLSRIRDIYELLIRNINEIGIRPICISFNGIKPDFIDVFRVVEYIFNNDKRLKEKKELVDIFKRNGFLGNNKRIFIVPDDLDKALNELKEDSNT